MVNEEIYSKLLVSLRHYIKLRYFKNKRERENGGGGGIFFIH